MSEPPAHRRPRRPRRPDRLTISALRAPARILREERRHYLLLNLMAYGLLLLGMAAGDLPPPLNALLVGEMGASGDTALVLEVIARPWLFALIILAVNLGGIVLVTILLPSMVVPFAGVVLFAVFAVRTGIVLAPVTEESALTLIPHSLTMALEFQAYILLLLGAVILGRSWIRPARAGSRTPRGGYLHGLRQIGVLAIPSLMLLVIGAVYEALSLRFIVPALLGVA